MRTQSRALGLNVAAAYDLPEQASAKRVRRLNSSAIDEQDGGSRRSNEIYFADLLVPQGDPNAAAAWQFCKFVGIRTCNETLSSRCDTDAFQIGGQEGKERKKPWPRAFAIS